MKKIILLTFLFISIFTNISWGQVIEDASGNKCVTIDSTRNTVPTANDMRNFLNRYYLSSEKSQGVSKVNYALLQNEHAIAISLLKSGENPNLTHTNKDIPSPLMIAVDNEDLELVSLMIKKSVNINANWYFDIPNNRKVITISPIELAIYRNKNTLITELLANSGAEVQHIWKFDALMLCIHNGSVDKFFTIVENATAPFDLKTIYHTNFSLLMLGTKRPTSLYEKDSALKMYQYLIENNVPMETNRSSALIYSITQGNMELTSLLVNNGANINHNSSPIFAAISYNTMWLEPKSIGFIAQRNEALNLLIDLGIKINYIDITSKFSPLTYAIHNNSNDAARLLIENGADIEMKDGNGQTPLVTAVSSNNITGVRILLEFGVNIHTKDKYQLTPIEIALAKGYSRIFNLLLEAEADNYQDVK